MYKQTECVNSETERESEKKKGKVNWKNGKKEEKNNNNVNLGSFGY